MVTPLALPRLAQTLHPGIFFWIMMVLGMAWQFVVSALLIRRKVRPLTWENLWPGETGGRRCARPPEFGPVQPQKFRLKLPEMAPPAAKPLLKLPATLWAVRLVM